MTMVFAMIETVEALENVEAIAATPGLDGLFVGPSDLSITLSRGAGIDKTGEATLGAMKKVAAAAKGEWPRRRCLRRQCRRDQDLSRTRASPSSRQRWMWT